MGSGEKNWQILPLLHMFWHKGRGFKCSIRLSCTRSLLDQGKFDADGDDEHRQRDRYTYTHVEYVHTYLLYMYICNIISYHII